MHTLVATLLETGSNVPFTGLDFPTQVYTLPRIKSYQLPYLKPFFVLGRPCPCPRLMYPCPGPNRRPYNPCPFLIYTCPCFLCLMYPFLVSEKPSPYISLSSVFVSPCRILSKVTLRAKSITRTRNMRRV